MKNNLYLICHILCLLIIISGCDDFFETDISENEVVILAPRDNLKTAVATRTFWWEAMEGAMGYRFQIVTPSFDLAERLLADSSLTSTQFTINLYPGEFEWRICAFNSVYQTPYVSRKLFIDSTMDLRAQQVVLSKPADQAVINSVIVLFQWQKLYNTETYNISVCRSEWTAAPILSVSQIIYDTIHISDLEEGKYVWGVKAWNSNSATGFTTRTLLIDRTSPQAPSLLEPQNKSDIDQLPVDLKWKRFTDEGASISDSVWISKDSVFSHDNIVSNKLVSEEYLYDAVQDTGTFFWKVRSIDAAGNRSPSSAVYKFTVLKK